MLFLYLFSGLKKQRKIIPEIVLESYSLQDDNHRKQITHNSIF